MPSSFARKLEESFRNYGQLCVGIDPHSALLEEWGVGDNVQGLRKFAFTVLEACVGKVGSIKPQVSFFERFGASGFQVLEDLATAAATSDILMIMDAKRGDIGTTMQGYSDAWLGKSAPFVCDALTLSPYLGVDSLLETMNVCLENGKGLFVLAATSNPEGKSIQRASVADQTLAKDVFDRIESINKVNRGAGEALGNFGIVVGATLNLQSSGLGTLHTDDSLVTPILAPGFGAQGATLKELPELFGASKNRVIASVSRSVLQAGPNGIATAIESAKSELLSN